MKAPWLCDHIAILDIGSATCSHCMLWDKIIRSYAKDVPVYRYTTEKDAWCTDYVGGKKVSSLPLIEVYRDGKLSGTFGGMPTKELRDAFAQACRADM